MKRVRRERNTSMLNSPSFPRSNTSPLVVGPQFGFIPPTPSEEIEALVLDGPLADSTLDMMEPLSLPSPIESPSLSHSSSRPSLRSRRWSDLTPSVAAKIKEELPSSASSPVGGIVAIKVIENYHAPVFVPDSKVDKCMQCFGGFGFWKRRHHCRLCGAVICYSCSTKVS